MKKLIINNNKIINKGEYQYFSKEVAYKIFITITKKRMRNKIVTLKDKSNFYIKTRGR